MAVSRNAAFFNFKNNKFSSESSKSTQNVIESIEDDSFIDLVKLEVLILAINRLVAIKNKTFRGLINLKELG